MFSSFISPNVSLRKMSRTGNIGIPTVRNLLVRCHTIRSTSDFVTLIIRKNVHIKFLKEKIIQLVLIYSQKMYYQDVFTVNNHDMNIKYDYAFTSIFFFLPMFSLVFILVGDVLKNMIRDYKYLYNECNPFIISHEFRIQVNARRTSVQ